MKHTSVVDEATFMLFSRIWINSEISILPVIVTVNWQNATLPLPSVAVYVTTELPIGKLSPGLALDVTVTTPELSEAVGAVHEMRVSAVPDGTCAEMSDGQLEKTGATLSEPEK